MGGNYDLGTIFSAFLTFTVIMLVVRFFIHRASKNRTQIERPEWLEDKRSEY
ncbi:MAG: hypothetical protein ACTTJS_07835 [Wolinella sp.]